MKDFDRDGLVSDLRMLADKPGVTLAEFRQLADDVAGGQYDVGDVEGIDLAESVPVYEHDQGYDAAGDL